MQKLSKHAQSNLRKIFNDTVYNGYSDIAGGMNFAAKFHYNHYITISNKLYMAYM